MTFGRTAAGIAALAMLSGCQSVRESNLNPGNWFGGNDDDQMVNATTVSDPFVSVPLIPRVTNVIVEETPGGAIIRAVGLPPEQGWFGAELVSESGGRPVDGVLRYAFVALPPLTPAPVSTEQSREIVVGRFISSRTLANTREIQVVAGENTITRRR